MTTIDLANNVVEGGFFLLKKQPVVPFEWPVDTDSGQCFVGTYRDSGTPIRDILLKMIRGAERRVFIVSFLLGDEELIDELIAAANRLKGGVYVITALDDHLLERGLREYEENDLVSPEEGGKNFERLTSRGIYVRGHDSCHAKYAVVDDGIGLVGSANFVNQGFTWTGEANVLLRNPDQVRQLRGLFTELWYAGCTWEIAPGEAYLVAKRAVQEPLCRPALPSGQTREIVWTNGPEQPWLLRAIQETIDAAEAELILSTYSIVRMTEKPHLILDHIRGALSRGVKIRLFVRQRNAWPEQIAELVALHDAGVEITGDLRNHAKVAIADAKQAVVFSANLDGNHGLDSGVEVGVRATESGCLRELTRYMNHVIENADTSFVRNPLHKQLDGRLAARWCSGWQWGDEVTIKCRIEDGERFARAARSSPVIYEQRQNELRLYASNLRFDIDIQGPPWSGRIAETLAPDTATTRLRDWLQSVHRSKEKIDGHRGFCPATLHLDHTGY